MNRSAALWTAAGAVVLMGLWTIFIPFVGPTFGYGMPPGADVPAWEWNASHFQRHVAPGVVAVVGGAMILARTRPIVLAGSWLALAAGIWFIISPFVPRAWLGSGGGGGGGGDVSTVMQIITPLGYHHVPGIVVIGITAFLLGWLHPTRQPALERKRGIASEADRPEEPRAVEGVRAEAPAAGSATTTSGDREPTPAGRGHRDS